MMTKTAILVTNLGTPDAPTTEALRRYLAEFLSDRYVVDLPPILWQPILRGIILPLRPKQSAKLYQNIWTEVGSPLLDYTLRLAAGIRDRLQDENNIVVTGMRYGNPSLQLAMTEASEQGATRLLVLPLYPQYAGATTGSTIAKVRQLNQKHQWFESIDWINSYESHPSYISALAQSIKKHWQQQGRADKLLLSFHGIPKKNVDRGDPYYDSCMKTAMLLKNALGITDDEMETVFQSRFGKAKWLQPYCVDRLEALPSEGIKKIDIICPGFSVDCLETLEEIAMTNQEIFMEKGGEEYRYIPALNNDVSHIDCLVGQLSEALNRTIFPNHFL